MIAIFRFFKATIIGGLLVLGPLVLLGIIVGKAVEIFRSALEPAVGWLPARSVGGISLTILAVLAVLLGLCFLAGLLAELTLTQRLIKWLEALVLTAIPGYALMKNVGESLAGVEGKEGRKTVLVQFERSSQIGFLMNTLPDGRLVVFIPNVPNCMAGTLHIVTADRVEQISMPISKAIDSLSRLGVDLGRVWQ